MFKGTDSETGLSGVGDLSGLTSQFLSCSLSSQGKNKCYRWVIVSLSGS